MKGNTEEALSVSINALEALHTEILHAGKEQIESHNGIYTFDLYCTAILNKAINIQAGYVSLIKAGNFISAAPLVRIHLDTLLRMFAASIWKGNVDEFAMKVLDGHQINKLEDKSGNKLTDGFLARELSKWKNFDWVSDIYKTGSSFVHFSDKHMYTSMQVDSQKTRTIGLVVGVHDKYVPIEEKIGATIYMSKITTGIVSFVNSWSAQKRTYPKLTSKNSEPEK